MTRAEFEAAVKSMKNDKTSGTDKISMYRFENKKFPESDNDHITITNTFWSTELNSRPILSHEGSICVSETQSDHFQSQKIGFRDKKSPQSKISESKTY